MGYRYSPPRTHPVYPPRVHPCRTQHHGEQLLGASAMLNSAVGLKSVRQLTLSAYFSGFQGMTEVYNLLMVDNPNDHKHITGFD